MNEFQACANSSSRSSLHALVEQSAVSFPSKTAVSIGTEKLCYRELNEQANQLARHLMTLGVSRESRVALLLGRGLHLVVSTLAVLKAGGAFLSVDPNLATDRVEFMLKDANAVVLISEQVVVNKLVNLDARLVVLEQELGIIQSFPTDNLVNRRSSESSLAYVVYTSGSTGKPKGVMIEHRSICSQINALTAAFDVTQEDNVLQFAAIGFDVFIEEMFLALANGAELVLRTDAWITDGDKFWALCHEHEITVLDLPVRWWTAMIGFSRDVPACVRLVVVGGEAVNEIPFVTGVRLVNAYGLTETTINATLFDLTPATCDQKIIGKPLQNVSIRVLDEDGCEQNLGDVGELAVGGVQVARGYIGEVLDNPSVVNFITGVDGARLFRTGDLVRQLYDGNLQFVGRRDLQVKVRGFRVEPSEIEGVMKSCIDAEDVAVLGVRDPLSEEVRLSAYFTLRDGQLMELKEDLRSKLMQLLPEFMVPASFRCLPRMPLTVSGKIDRKALARIDSADISLITSFQMPGLTLSILRIWCDILKAEITDINADFFALGGTSLLATQVVNRFRSELHLEVPLQWLFVARTIKALVVALSAAQEHVSDGT